MKLNVGPAAAERLKLPWLKEAALHHSCLTVAGCRVNVPTGAKWVRVEMGARPWRHANASSPLPCSSIR